MPEPETLKINEVEYEDLPESQRMKDTLFQATVRGVAASQR